MRVVTHPEAQREIAAAVEYYENCVAGLGRDFLNELTAASDRVREHPEAYPVWQRGARRCLLHRFPYSLIYLLQEAQITVVAVMHNRRRPGYWAPRTQTT